MDARLRKVLWVLSSLAVIWTVTALAGLVGMIPMHGAMMGSASMDSMMGSGMMGGAMTLGMTICMVITPIVMLGLDGVFIYLIMTARHTPRVDPA